MNYQKPKGGSEHMEVQENEMIIEEIMLNEYVANMYQAHYYDPYELIDGKLVYKKKESTPWDAFKDGFLYAKNKYNMILVKEIQLKVFSEIISERHKQDIKWGEQNHKAGDWTIIAGEEFGEACKSILEGDWENYRNEMVQLAAVCAAAVECYDRNFKKEENED